jgi:hypothetical protein
MIKTIKRINNITIGYCNLRKTYQCSDSGGYLIEEFKYKKSAIEFCTQNKDYRNPGLHIVDKRTRYKYIYDK